MTPSDIDEVIKIAKQPDVLAAFSQLHRADLLPSLFRVRGEPYSLADYPQFRTMYDPVYVPDTIWMCGRQLGKSMNLSRSEIMDMLTIPHMQLLFVAPLQQQTQRYSTLYLTEAINSCPLARLLQRDDIDLGLADSKIVKSVGHQAFSNGAGIQLTYAKTSSDRARGIYADRIDFDEIQDQLVDNIPIISESLTASSWGIRRFTGTAKTTDNTIEAFWQKSAQCEWVMKCSGCNHWNIPNEDGRVIDMIQSDGVHCVKCGKKLNVREGQWVPAHRKRMKEFLGYHIPQIVVPAIVENPHKWAGIIRKIMRVPSPIVMQEVLGISCSIGARIITQDDIEQCSVLPPMVELQNKLRDYVITVGGVDWGVAELQSFTVHTIIGVKPDGKIDVLWARRFAGFDPDEVMTEIAKAQSYYGCCMLAADFGMGFDKNIMLANRFGLPVIQMMYLNQQRLFSYNPFHQYPRWVVDRNTALELLFLAIKYGRIRFPPQTEFKNFTDDLLSPYEEIVENVGIPRRHFVRNPNQPDDFCHALCFACLVAMRLMNQSVVDLVPTAAFSGGRIGGGAPIPVELDPADVLAVLSV
jgi:hypothetical protein